MCYIEYLQRSNAVLFILKSTFMGVSPMFYDLSVQC